MRVVIVVDPVGDDGEFVRRIADRAAAGLRRGGRHVDVLDLVAQGFPAAMSGAERRAYFGDRPLICSETAAAAELVRRADGLVFVYPTTLSTVPAGMKGWIERVLVPGVAFTIGHRGSPERGLSNVRHLAGVTIHAAPRRHLARDDNGRRLIRRNIRLCAGLRTRSSWLAMYGAAQATDADRSAFLAKVERRLERV